jgi:hypothetical protein
MKKYSKVLFPSAFLLIFGLSAMIMVSSCEKDDGSWCSVCVDSSQCNDGLSCFEMSGAGSVPRCVEKKGDVCY